MVRRPSQSVRRMAFPKPPEKITPFNSGPVAAHDIGRQFDEHRRATSNVIDFLRTIVRDDGRLKNGLIGPEQMSPELPDLLAKRAVDAIGDLLASVRQSASEAAVSADEVRRLRENIDALRIQIAGSAAAMSRAGEEVRMRLSSLDAEIDMRVAALVPAGMLGPQYANFYATDEQSSAPLSSDYAQVSIAWAEYMEGNATIPPNILAINAITGDHWSSRWWANRSANAFGMMAWWYQGAWPQPGPPTTPNTPTGQPLPPGSIYFDTDLGVMMVWNGSTWVNASAPAKGATSSLYYLASAGQTVFPLGTVDLNGHTFAFNQTTPEGLQAYVNGVRLTPTLDFSLDTVGSSVTFLHGLSLNSIVAFDMLTPASMLAPSGSANTVLLNPITPDGTKTVFTGLTVAAGGAAVNVAKNEELLVSVNGVQQSPGAAYNATGSTITFAQAPEADALIFIVWFGPSSGTRAVAPPSSLWSAADAAANGMTLSNGGLTISGNSAQNKTARTIVGHSSGKYYVEFLCVTANGNEGIGLASSGFNALGKLGASNYSGGVAYGSNWVSAGFTSIATTFGLAGTGDVAGIAVDFATGNIWYSQNNVWVAGLFSDDNVVQPRDPSSGANPIISFVPATVGTLFPAITIYGYDEVWTLQSTAASQKYAPPSGFKAWDAP